MDIIATKQTGKIYERARNGAARICTKDINSSPSVLAASALLTRSSHGCCRGSYWGLLSLLAFGLNFCVYCCRSLLNCYGFNQLTIVKFNLCYLKQIVTSEIIVNGESLIFLLNYFFKNQLNLWPFLKTWKLSLFVFF